MSALADAITRKVAASGQASARIGRVTGVTGARVNVDVAGSSLTLPRLAAYAPAAGDVVLILTGPEGWTVLGKIAT